MRFDGAQLSVEVRSPVLRVVRVAGLLDAVTVLRLADLIEVQLERTTCAGDLIVDLGEISFFGTGDLGALLRARDAGRAVGVRLHLAGFTDREPMLPVHITGALAQFSMFSTVERAERELISSSSSPGVRSTVIADGPSIRARVHVRA